MSGGRDEEGIWALKLADPPDLVGSGCVVCDMSRTEVSRKSGGRGCWGKLPGVVEGPGSGGRIDTNKSLRLTQEVSSLIQIDISFLGINIFTFNLLTINLCSVDPLSLTSDVTVTIHNCL